MVIFFDDSSLKRRRKAKKLPPIQRAAIPPAKNYELLTPNELWALDHSTFIFDVECYPNYFLVSFKDTRSGNVIFFERTPNSFIINDQPVSFQLMVEILNYLLYRHLLVGFNSIAYDLPMIGYFLDGLGVGNLKEKSNQIIREEKGEFQIRLAKINHIDLIEVAPLQASLKLYAGRLHAPRMQDLPFDDQCELTPVEAMQVRDYNINDLDNTELLWKHLKPQLDIRQFLSEEYKQDLRSKSDAQIGEAIVMAELGRIGIRPKKPTFEPGSTFKYQMPPNLYFQTEQLNKLKKIVANATFVVGNNGHADLPSELDGYRLNIGNCTYRIGIGGLHSSEKEFSVFATEDILLLDRDVASYYPNIIINQCLFPDGCGPEFVSCFANIVSRRLKAKAEGNKPVAEGLKIGINGVFGKFANIYSRLYSHNLVTQVTLSGQLYLLMLIEALELGGIEVVSANTDGVVSKVRKTDYQRFTSIVETWERITNFVTEEVKYRSLHCRDVNNYIAIKDSGDWKAKGVFSEFGSALNSILSKNPESLIVADAISARLSRAIPLAETIRNCNDFRRFISVRTVKGGAHKDGIYLGKAIRWYYSTDITGTINYVLTGNVVPKTQGARPCMILPETIPHDLDYDYYIKQAEQALYDIGFKRRATVGKLL